MEDNARVEYFPCGCGKHHDTLQEMVDCVMRKHYTGKPLPDVVRHNLQMVVVVANTVEIKAVRTKMTRFEALAHAAWIVALCDGEDEFCDILADLQGLPVDKLHA